MKSHELKGISDYEAHISICSVCTIMLNCYWIFFSCYMNLFTMEHMEQISLGEVK